MEGTEPGSSAAVRWSERTQVGTSMRKDRFKAWALHALCGIHAAMNMYWPNNGLHIRALDHFQVCAAKAGLLHYAICSAVHAYVQWSHTQSTETVGPGRFCNFGLQAVIHMFIDLHATFFSYTNAGSKARTCMCRLSRLWQAGLSAHHTVSSCPCAPYQRPGDDANVKTQCISYVKICVCTPLQVLFPPCQDLHSSAHCESRVWSGRGCPAASQ